jgi:hypothetical protein
MSEIILLSNVRLSFPHLAEPQRQVNESNGKERISYNCEFIMPQDHAGFQKFMATYAAMALEKWKEHAQTVMGMIQSDRKLRCFGRGEEKVNKKTFQPYDGYAGHAFITAGRDSAPQMIQADGQPIDPANTMAYQMLARKMYGGCRVNAAIKPWLQENSYGRGVRCDLIAVQFAGDDGAFGEGAVDASKLFGSVGLASDPAAMFNRNFANAPVNPAPAMGLPPFMMGQS